MIFILCILYLENRLQTKFQYNWSITAFLIFFLIGEHFYKSEQFSDHHTLVPFERKFINFVAYFNIQGVSKGQVNPYGGDSGPYL